MLIGKLAALNESIESRINDMYQSNQTPLHRIRISPLQTNSCPSQMNPSSKNLHTNPPQNSNLLHRAKTTQGMKLIQY